MPTFTPTLTGNPNTPTYNVGYAETNSWIPQSSPDANRAIFARATYLVNPQDIKVPGFNLPSYDSVTPAYYGSTDNFNTVSYYKNSTLVAVLSFTYVVQPPTVNAERVSNITRTV
jgi:hypothetical protein